MRDAQAGMRDRAPEPMRGKPAWQAGMRDRAPELMRGRLRGV